MTDRVSSLSDPRCSTLQGGEDLDEEGEGLLEYCPREGLLEYNCFRSGLRLGAADGAADWWLGPGVAGGGPWGGPLGPGVAALPLLAHVFARTSALHLLSQKDRRTSHSWALVPLSLRLQTFRK